MLACQGIQRDVVTQFSSSTQLSATTMLGSALLYLSCA